MKRSERYRQYAENARRRAQEAHDKAERTFDQIPVGQPIITGRGSRTTADINRRDRAFANIGKAADEYKKAQAWEYSAKRREHYEQRLEQAQAETHEGVSIGDEVTACFTNSHRFHRFHGVIVGRTVNSWKVRCLENFRGSEEVGRVFAIPALGKPTYSANHRVYKLEAAADEPLSPREQYILDTEPMHCRSCGHMSSQHTEKGCQASVGEERCDCPEYIGDFDE